MDVLVRQRHRALPNVFVTCGATTRWHSFDMIAKISVTALCRTCSLRCNHELTLDVVDTPPPHRITCRWGNTVSNSRNNINFVLERAISWALQQFAEIPRARAPTSTAAKQKNNEFLREVHNFILSPSPSTGYTGGFKLYEEHLHFVQKILVL